MTIAVSTLLNRLVFVTALMALVTPGRAATPGSAVMPAAAPAVGCNGLLQQSYLRLQDEKPQSL